MKDEDGNGEEEDLYASILKAGMFANQVKSPFNLHDIMTSYQLELKWKGR